MLVVSSYIHLERNIGNIQMLVVLYMHTSGGNVVNTPMLVVLYRHTSRRKYGHEALSYQKNPLLQGIF